MHSISVFHRKVGGSNHQAWKTVYHFVLKLLTAESKFYPRYIQINEALDILKVLSKPAIEQ